MKKILTLASMVLLVAGAAFAGVGEDRLFVQSNATFSPTLVPVTGASGDYATGLATGPSTTNNDDSCDISVMPAATLLLPYFEVDFRAASTAARNTVFTITNTTPQPQIAHITIWTDWSFPVIDFNIWLTGYDVQPISLYDLIRNGNIPVTGYLESNIGTLSDDVVVGGVYLGGNPNHNLAAINDPLTGCDSLPGPIPGALLADIQSALTAGTYSTCAGRIGGTNANAVGYITIDVADKCSQLLPTDPVFYAQDILFDNTLIGEYIHINPSSTTGNYAGGETMVHIRAIPEGGPVENPVLGTPAIARNTGTNFPYTFYDRYTVANASTPGLIREADRRQPLPGTFAARYIADVATGPTGFETYYSIWREGVISGNPSCAVNAAIGGSGNSVYGANRNLPARRIVRFDEQENPNVVTGCRFSPCPGELFYNTEETSRNPVSNATFFPADSTATDDLGGWMYLNLNGNGCIAPNCTDRVNGASQAWVTVGMQAEGRYAVEFDAAALGNGCSTAPVLADPIRPAANWSSTNVGDVTP